MNATVPRRTKNVVAALIVDPARPGQVLVSQRRSDQSFAGQWEFPGGKMEPDEDPQQALRREIQEELGVQIEVGAIWDVLFARHAEFNVLMLVYLCRVVEGLPHAREVAAVTWTTCAALGELDVMSADAPLVSRLRREGSPSYRL